MCYINITVVLLYKDIFSDLISTTSVSRIDLLAYRMISPVDEGIVESKFEYEVAQMGLNLTSRILASI